MVDGSVRQQFPPGSSFVVRVTAMYLIQIVYNTVAKSIFFFAVGFELYSNIHLRVLHGEILVEVLVFFGLVTF